MISIDTNLLVHAHNRQAAEHTRAREFIEEMSRRDDVVVCELVLVELYLVLRSPAVFAKPLDPRQTVAVCDAYRSNPRWKLVEHAPVMSDVWAAAREASFARRRIIDARLAFTLQHHGVTAFATDNTRHFEGLGFERVWNPLRPAD